ncbi:SDR family NAD(P)-dependent oxidoreductase [Nocardia sp. NPDC003693]
MKIGSVTSNIGIARVRDARVLIVGAGGAIGRRVAARFAELGARLVLADRDVDALAELRSELAGPGRSITVLGCDVLDDNAVRELITRAEAEAGPIDILVATAGVEFNAQFHTSSFDDLDRQLSMHLRAPMLLIHSVLPGMLERGRGHIVVVSSLNGKIPFPAKVPYCAAKSGAIAMIHALRREYAQSPVGFSLVLPAIVSGAGQAQRALDESGARLPRLAPTTTPERCADAVLDAVERGRAEVAVSSSPNAPLAGLQWSVPVLVDKLLELSGMSGFWRRVGGLDAR